MDLGIDPGLCLKMGKSGKLFKSLVAGVKAFKSPTKEKPEKDKSASNPDKNRLKKGNKEKCLWSLGKSASRNRDSFAPEVACLDVPELKSNEVENNQVKDVPITDQSFTAKPDYGSRGLIKSEDASLTECGPIDLAEQEERAAIKIQAAYRCHLASHQALRPLRAVVRLQALVRGYMVRKHASAALRCIQALVKIQALARGRRVRASELGQLIQKHLQQTQQRKKLVENWVSNMVPVQSFQAKAESKQDAVVKRQRALVYAFSEQLNKCESKKNSSSTIDFQPDKSHWSWVWLERWMAAHPWGHPSVATKEEHSKEAMVYIKADAEVNCDRDASYLHTHVPSSNIEKLCSSDNLDDYISHSQSTPSAMDKEPMPYMVQTSEDCRHTPTDLRTAQPEPKSETEGYNSETKEAAERPLLSPPPPPPQPPPNAKRPKPVVACQTSSNKGKRAAYSLNIPYEMSGTMEAVRDTSSLRGAEQLSDTCTSTIATLLESSSANVLNTPFEKSLTMEPRQATSSTRDAEVLGKTNTSPLATHLESVDLTSPPGKDLIPSTSAHLSISTSTTQSHPDSPLHCAQYPATTTSTTPDADEVWNAKHHISMPMTEPSDCAPSLALQPPLLPTTSSEMLVLPQTQPDPLSPATFSEMLVLPPHTHAIACSLSFPDVIHDKVSNGVYTRLDNGTMDSTLSMVENINGSNEGGVTENSTGCGSVDLKDDPIESDMDVEGPPESDSIDCKHSEAIKAASLYDANGVFDAFIVSAGEKSTEASPSKYRSPVSKQGQNTEAVSPSLPKYMTTTKSSQAKIRTLTSLKQKSDSPKQKRESPKPRFDTSKQKVGDSPKLKFESPKQKVDSFKQRLDFSKQKLDSPKQRVDHAAKRRHSLSALEGKGSPTRSKSTLAAKVNWHL